MFVVTTSPQKEKYAKKELEKTGFKVYMPSQIKERKRKGKVINTYEKLLFPSYLFIDINCLTDREYYKIKDVPFFRKFLGKIKESEEEYIRFLANNGKPLPRIEIHFDENNRARILNEKNILSENIIGVNRRDRKVRIKIDTVDKEHIIILNYKIV